jgi:hypothetical protein
VNEGLYDEAPDEPPSGGFPERRQDQRRTDDRLAHDMEGWVARLFIYRGRIIALVSSVTFLLTALGFRIIGPSQDIKALDQKFSAKDSIMSARVTRIEDSQGQIKGQFQVHRGVDALPHLHGLSGHGPRSSARHLLRRRKEIP